MIKQVVSTMIVSAMVITPIASHIQSEVTKPAQPAAQTAIVEVAEVKTASLDEIAEEVLSKDAVKTGPKEEAQAPSEPPEAEVPKEERIPEISENRTSGDSENTSSELEEAKLTENAETPTAGTKKTTSKTSSKTTSKTSSAKTTSTKTSSKAATPAEVAKEAKKRGNYGRLIIPEAGINVAVFFTKDYSKLQKIVDAKDSACMFNWTKGNKFVADHNNQDFGALRTKKYSKMQIVTPSGVENYKLVEKISNGLNKGSNLTYKDGTSIGAKHQNSMVLYTCNPTKGSVTITVWERVK